MPIFVPRDLFNEFSADALGEQANRIKEEIQRGLSPPPPPPEPPPAPDPVPEPSQPEPATVAPPAPPPSLTPPPLGQLMADAGLGPPPGSALDGAAAAVSPVQAAAPPGPTPLSDLLNLAGLGGPASAVASAAPPPLQDVLHGAGLAPAAAAPPTTAAAGPPAAGFNDISQFGDKALSTDEAYAACGPAAAVRFAQRFGRNPSLREATDLAAQVGWTTGAGMAGLQSEKTLMDRLQVPTRVVDGPQWDQFAREASTGNPVTISTPGHYFFADSYNPQTGQFHVGQSGRDLRQGSEWMTREQMEGLMGAAQGALFADSPTVGAPSTATAAPPQPGGDPTAAIMGGAANVASWLGDQGQKALQSVLATEDGMTGKRGDAGRSAGPLQFFEGGQLANFASAMGMALDQAKQYVEANPMQAIQWAIGVPSNPGYLGRAIADGMAQGLTGAALATYAQRHGQVSDNPERAGQNYNAMFGSGQPPVSGGQSAAPNGFAALAQTGGQLAQQGAALAGSLNQPQGEPPGAALDRQTGQQMASLQQQNAATLQGGLDAQSQRSVDASQQAAQAAQPKPLWQSIGDTIGEAISQGLQPLIAQFQASPASPSYNPPGAVPGVNAGPSGEPMPGGPSPAGSLMGAIGEAPGLSEADRAARAQAIGESGVGQAYQSDARKEYLPNITEPNHPANVIPDLLAKYNDPSDPTGARATERMTDEDRAKMQNAMMAIGGMSNPVQAGRLGEAGKVVAQDVGRALTGQAGSWLDRAIGAIPKIGRGAQAVAGELPDQPLPNWPTYEMEQTGARAKTWYGDTPFTPTEVRNIAQKAGFQESSPEEFFQAISRAARQPDLENPGKLIGDSLSAYPLEDYAKMRTFLAKDGGWGYALKPREDGVGSEIVSVFKANEAPRGAGIAATAHGIEQGATHLDAYDINDRLPRLYSRFGFTEVDRGAYDPQYAAPGTQGLFKDPSTGKWVQPEVVMMERGTPAAEQAAQEQNDRLLRLTARAVRAGEPPPPGATIVHETQATPRAQGAPGTSGAIDIPHFVDRSGQMVPLRSPATAGTAGEAGPRTFVAAVGRRGGRKAAPVGRFTRADGTQVAYDSPGEAIFMSDLEEAKKAGTVSDWWRSEDSPIAHLKNLRYINTHPDKFGYGQYKGDFVIRTPDGALELREVKDLKALKAEEHGGKAGVETGKLGWHILKKAIGVIPELAKNDTRYRIVDSSDAGKLLKTAVSDVAYRTPLPPRLPSGGFAGRQARTVAGMPGISPLDVPEISAHLPGGTGMLPAHEVGRLINDTSLRALEMARNGASLQEITRMTRDALLPTADIMGRTYGPTRMVRDATVNVGDVFVDMARTGAAELRGTWPQAADIIDKAAQRGVQIDGIAVRAGASPGLSLKAAGDPAGIEAIAAELGQLAEAGKTSVMRADTAPVSTGGRYARPVLVDTLNPDAEMALDEIGRGLGDKAYIAYNPSSPVASIHLVDEDPDVAAGLARRLADGLGARGIDAKIGEEAQVVVTDLAEEGYGTAIARRREQLGETPLGGAYPAGKRGTAAERAGIEAAGGPAADEGAVAQGGGGTGVREPVPPGRLRVFNPYSPSGEAASYALSPTLDALPSRPPRGGGPVAGLLPGAPAARNVDRFYHGTAGEFARPTADKLDPSGLYGPGYYLTSDARIAGGIVAKGGEAGQPVRDAATSARLGADVSYPTERYAGDVIEPGYAQQRGPTGETQTAMQERLDRMMSRVDEYRSMQAEAQRAGDQGGVREASEIIDSLEQNVAALRAKLNPRAGPNVRPVDVPRDLNLLDADNLLPAPDLNAIRQSLTGEQAAVFRNNLDTRYGAKGDDVYRALRTALETDESGILRPASEVSAEANKLLASAGFDGIKYAGGRRTPMADSTGQNIEHTVAVIFPESLDKITNATAGTPGGLVAGTAPEVGLGGVAARAAAGGLGAGVQEAQQPEATPESVGKAALGGASLSAARTGLSRVAPGATAPITRQLAIAGRSARDFDLDHLAQMRADDARKAAAPPPPPPPGSAQRSDWLQGKGKWAPPERTEPTLTDKYVAYTTADMLSGIGSMTQNTIGGIVQNLYRPLETAAAGRPTDAIRDVGAMMAGMDEHFRRFGATFKTGERANQSYESSMPTGILAPLSVPLRMLAATDEFMRSAAAAGSQAAEASRLMRQNKAASFEEVVSKFHDQLVEEGARASAEATFTRGGGFMGALGERAASWRQDLLRSDNVDERFLGAVMQTLLPMTRVPGVILGEGLRGLPVVNEVTGIIGTARAIQRGDTVAAGRERARMMLASFANMAIADQVVQGNITGNGPDNAADRARLMEAVDADGNPVWRPNSVKIGGRWFDHSGLGPISVRMSSIANLVDEAHDFAQAPPEKRGDIPELGVDLVKRQVQSVAQAWYLRNLSDILSAVHDGNLGVFGTQIVAGGDRLIPAGGLLNEIRRLEDPIAREVEKSPLGLLQREQNRLPFLSSGAGGLLPAVPPRLAATTGQPVEQPRDILSTIIRGSAPGMTPNPVAVEVSRLTEGGNRVSVPREDQMYAGARQSVGQTRQIQQVSGAAINQYVLHTMQQPGYDRLTDKQKADALQQAVGQAQEDANLTLGGQVARGPHESALWQYATTPQYSGINKKAPPEQIARQNWEIAQARALRAAYIKEDGDRGELRFRKEHKEAFRLTERHDPLDKDVLARTRQRIDQATGGQLTQTAGRASTGGLVGVGSTTLPAR